MQKLLGFLAKKPDSPAPQFLAARGEFVNLTGSRRSAGIVNRGGFSWNNGRIIVSYQGRPILPDKGAQKTGEGDLTEEIVNLYLRFGNDFLSRIVGSFAIAILEPDAGRAILAVDRMGIEKLAYSLDSAGLIFGQSAREVATARTSGKHLRDQALYDFMLMHMVPAPNTVFDGVAKLPAASYLSYERGKSRMARYWRPHFRESRFEDRKSLEESLHESLLQAVVRLNPDEKTGAFLSGGLDSSCVAGKLQEIQTHPAMTFSVGFGVQDYDELNFAQLANRHFGCSGHEYHVTPADVISTIPLIAESFDEPFGNSSAVPTYFCARLAAENSITHLLAGDGGDELFGGNERYSRHQLFETYGALPSLLRTQLVDRVANRISPNSALAPARKLRSYVDQARIPLPDRFESWNYVFRVGPTTIFSSDFLDSIEMEAPLQVMRDVWESSRTRSVVNQMLEYDWHFTLASNDLRKVGTMCTAAGIHVSYPMLDSEVVEFSTRIPPRLKATKTELRIFYKRAMQAYLPANIITKRKQGFGLPFGVWLKTDTNLSDLVHSSMISLRRRHIISAVFIDSIMEQYKTGHPGYFGSLIWDLLSLEEWLEANS